MIRHFLSSGHWSFFCAVTFVLRCDAAVVVVNKYFLLVVVNNGAHVQHAAVTHFHVEIVLWWEVFLD